MTATPDQYGENISFLWKIIFLMVAGLLNLILALDAFDIRVGRKA